MTGSWKASSTRYAIYHRDAFRCVYCGATKAEGAALTLDHVVTRDAVRSGRAEEPVQGLHHPTNLVTACSPCNTTRGDRTLRQWVIYLRTHGVPATVAKAIPARVRAQTALPLDRAEGRRLALAVANPAWGFAKYIK